MELKWLLLSSDKLLSIMDSIDPLISNLSSLRESNLLELVTLQPILEDKSSQRDS
jgi:hypothetical protein